MYIHINYLPSWHSRFFDHVCQNFSHFLDIVQFPSTWRIQVLIRSDNQFLGGLLWNCHSNAYSCQMGLRYSDTVIQLARQSQLVLDRPSRYRRGYPCTAQLFIVYTLRCKLRAIIKAYRVSFYRIFSLFYAAKYVKLELIKSHNWWFSDFVIVPSILSINFEFSGADLLGCLVLYGCLCWGKTRLAGWEELLIDESIFICCQKKVTLYWSGKLPYRYWVIDSSMVVNQI